MHFLLGIEYVFIFFIIIFFLVFFHLFTTRSLLRLTEMYVLLIIFLSHFLPVLLLVALTQRP